jgi:transposase
MLDSGVTVSLATLIN